MGRPKLSDVGPVPTRERILQRALEMFARKGYDAVSVREITRSLELNEATLYIHYRNKADLLEAIFTKLEESLLKPGFTVPPVEMFRTEKAFSLSAFLVEGAKLFYGRTDRNTLLTWRILIMNQYAYEAAKNSVKAHLLEAPEKFFIAMLKNIKSAGKIWSHVDTESAGRIIAAIFFQYSFTANLNAAWENERSEEFRLLEKNLKLLGRLLEVKQ